MSIVAARWVVFAIRVFARAPLRSKAILVGVLVLAALPGLIFGTGHADDKAAYDAAGGVRVEAAPTISVNSVEAAPVASATPEGQAVLQAAMAGYSQPEPDGTCGWATRKMMIDPPGDLDFGLYCERLGP
jgi:hypothetical protein